MLHRPVNTRESWIYQMLVSGEISSFIDEHAVYPVATVYIAHDYRRCKLLGERASVALSDTAGY